MKQNIFIIFDYSNPQNMASSTEENYLKALFMLMNERGEVAVSELSNLLKVKTPTVNSMIKNLYEQKLVKYEKYKPVTLTSKGKKMAALIIRKHRLTEMFLVEKMGFGWEEVHEIAEQIEHIDSPIFFERMDELMGCPTVDPHGSPIPDKDGKIQTAAYEPLSRCKTGEQVILSGLNHSSGDFLRFLNSRQLILGTKLLIRSVETYDNSMVVSYSGHKSETLSPIVCEQLLVIRIK